MNTGDGLTLTFFWLTFGRPVPVLYFVYVCVFLFLDAAPEIIVSRQSS